MSKHHSFINTVDQIVTDGVKKGILHLNLTDQMLNGNTFTLGEREVVNFGSCSYLGLEFNYQMILEARHALEEYGTQFSASRAYVSSCHYVELENLLTKIFGSPTIVAPTVTLGHIATIPVIIEDDDAIILDHQAHNSMQTAVNLVKPRGVHVEMIRHNRMDILEERIKILRQKHKKIWYVADGVYSMYGDFSKVGAIHDLMDKYREFHYYVDDAHSMSCFGKHGRGYVLTERPMHDKMILTTSLNKAFAAGGGALIFPNEEMARKVRTCGGPFLSSGPMQPAALGAALASARIHLSDKIYKMQDELRDNIRYCNLMLEKYGLPNISKSDSPVFFVGVGLPKIGYNLIKRMLDDGFYLNLGIFPTVPMKNTGVRFTITRLHTFEQIENMVSRMAHHYPLALNEEGFTMDKVYRAFKLRKPLHEKLEAEVASVILQSDLTVQLESSISDIDQELWDKLLGDRGTFDWQGLQILESSFRNNKIPEHNWKFNYLIVKDNKGEVILATFLTTCIAKDDIFSPVEISRQLEEIRKDQPNYMTSTVLTMGSMLTEGNHLYLNRESKLWKASLQILFEQLSKLQDQYKASAIHLRDLEDGDAELDSLFVDNGYFKIEMPDNHIVRQLNWKDTAEYLSRLSKKSRRHVREFALRYEHLYTLNEVKSAKDDQIDKWYELYLNVKRNSLRLNTFDLPKSLFKNMVDNESWDIIELWLDPSEVGDQREKVLVVVMFSYICGENYNPMIIGLDYSYQKDFKCYRQALYQVIKRAKTLKLQNVRLGFSATIEKRKFGAEAHTPIAYVQTVDNFNIEVLGTMSLNGSVK